MTLTTNDILQKPMKIFGPGIVFTWVNEKVTNLSKLHHRHNIRGAVIVLKLAAKGQIKPKADQHGVDSPKKRTNDSFLMRKAKKPISKAKHEIFT